jgi:hypothetical protein
MMVKVLSALGRCCYVGCIRLTAASRFCCALGGYDRSSRPGEGHQGAALRMEPRPQGWLAREESAPGSSEEALSLMTVPRPCTRRARVGLQPAKRAA